MGRANANFQHHYLLWRKRKEGEGGEGGGGTGGRVGNTTRTNRLHLTSCHPPNPIARHSPSSGVQKKPTVTPSTIPHPPALPRRKLPIDTWESLNNLEKSNPLLDVRKKSTRDGGKTSTTDNPHPLPRRVEKIQTLHEDTFYDSHTTPPPHFAVPMFMVTAYEPTAAAAPAKKKERITSAIGGKITHPLHRAKGSSLASTAEADDSPVSRRTLRNSNAVNLVSVWS